MLKGLGALLAEASIVGLSTFAIPAAWIFLREWPRRHSDAAAQTTILVLAAFTIVSSVHELLYQRRYGYY